MRHAHAIPQGAGFGAGCGPKAWGRHGDPGHWRAMTRHGKYGPGFGAGGGFRGGWGGRRGGPPARRRGGPRAPPVPLAGGARNGDQPLPESRGRSGGAP